MTRARTGLLVAALGVALAGLLAGDAATVGVGRGDQTVRPAWTEVKWPFLMDQWGFGRAYRCGAADCGVEINVYMRAKIGFCNCASGVSDDEELDRVGDLELFSDKFVALAGGQTISVGWMSGRSRPYRVAIPYGVPRDMQAIAFNDKCDVVVATIDATGDRLLTAERLTLDFLNGAQVLGWVKRELGI
jgi:hypothetical protein